MTSSTMKLSDEDYENLYEASLLDYSNALDALEKATDSRDGRNATSNDDDDEDESKRRRHRRRSLLLAERHARLLCAGAERLGVLHVCARDNNHHPTQSSTTTTTTFAQALLHQDERQLSHDVARHAHTLHEAFLLLPPSVAAAAKAAARSSSNNDDEDWDVDMDGFFRDYPHAMKKRQDEANADVEEDESDDQQECNDNDGRSGDSTTGNSNVDDDDIQCLGVKKPPAKKTARIQESAFREGASARSTGSEHSSTTGRDEPPHHHPSHPTFFQYTPQDGSLSSLPSGLPPTTAPTAAADVSTVRPPLPSTTNSSFRNDEVVVVDANAATAAARRRPRPEEEPSRQQQHQHQYQQQQQAWDDHHYHAQNPFQTAREYAQAGGGGGGGVENNAAASNRNMGSDAYQTSSSTMFARPSNGPPPPPPHAPTVGYNPYLKPSSISLAAPPEPPGPEPPMIRDSLRRKFQPPKLGAAAAATASTTAANSNHRAPSGGVLVKQALGAGGGSGNRPGSASGRPNGRGGGTNAQIGGGGGATNAGAGNDDDDMDLPEELRRYGKDLVDKILGEIMDSGEPVTFAEIAGLEDVKQTVQEVVCWPMKRPDLFTGLRKATNGLLLFGPPGTGKTLIGKAIAHESGATFFSISSSSLTSKWIGEGEKLVRTLFAVAAYREPAVVFIDEIDSLLTQRKADENEASRRIKTEFLVQLDGTGTSGQGRVLVVGATNRPQELDDAARRRFVKRLYIPLPEEPDRECLLRVLLEKNNHEITDDEVKKLANDTAGFSGADLKSLCTEAAMGPIRQLGEKALEVNAKDVPPIMFRHFRIALRRTKPSVAPADLVQYEAFDATYGFRNAENDESLDDDETP